MPRGLLSSRLQSSWNWVQTLALCPSYTRTSASSACYINVRLMWGEKWLCWCGFPGDGAWSLLNLALIAECVLCLSCICQHVHTRTGRHAYNTVIEGNQMGFSGTAGEIVHFAQPLFPSILTLFTSLSLWSSSITLASFQKWNVYYFLLWPQYILNLPWRVID